MSGSPKELDIINFKKKLDSSIVVEELIDKKRARMDIVIEKVEVPVNEGQIEITSDKVLKSSDNKEEIETTIAKEDQDIIGSPLVEKDLAISNVNGEEDTSENSNSILDNEKRDVLAPVKIDKNISIIEELIRNTDLTMWGSINYDEPYTTVELSSYSAEYQRIYNKFDKDCYRIIEDIKRVQNPFLYIQYHLKRYQKESNGKVKEHTLFHGTKNCNEDSICKHNLDFRKMGSNGFRYNKFGNGISFATNSMYATDYPRKSCELVRTMFVVKVSEVSSCPGESGLVLPPEPADIAVSTNVFVKFFDNEFYPEYMVHYRP